MTTQINQEETQVLAADFGFGFCKVFDGKNYLIMPTAAERFDTNYLDKLSTYELEGKTYVIGKDAERGSINLRSYANLEDHVPLFFFSAIQYFKLDPSKEIILSTGLSLTDWSKREQFANRLSNFVINNTPVNNVKVMITPQGKGAYIAACKLYPYLRDKLVLVIDLGTHTIDNLYFDKGVASGRDCWATRDGTHSIITAIKSKVNLSYNVNFSDVEINKILQTKEFTLRGEVYPIDELIDTKVKDYTDKIMSEIQTRDSSLYNRCDAIVFAGGGTTLADKYLPKDKHIIRLEDPQLANVNGYWEAANAKNSARKD